MGHYVSLKHIVQWFDFHIYMCFQTVIIIGSVDIIPFFSFSRAQVSKGQISVGLRSKKSFANYEN